MDRKWTISETPDEEGLFRTFLDGRPMGRFGSYEVGKWFIDSWNEDNENTPGPNEIIIPRERLAWFEETQNKGETHDT